MCVFLRVESKGEEKASEREKRFLLLQQMLCVCCAHVYASASRHSQAAEAVF
jgi:hypothetical protein